MLRADRPHRTAGDDPQSDPSLARHRASEIPPDSRRARAGRRRRPDQRPDHDEHADPRRRGDGRSDRALRRRRRRHRPRVLSRRGVDEGAARDRPRKPGAARRRHPFPLSPRDRGRRGGRGLSEDQPGQHRKSGPRARGDRRRPRQRMLDPHRRERGLARETSAGEIRRTLSRRDGRERARAHPHSRGQRFPRVQDQREGVGRLHGGRRVSRAGRRHRRADPSRDHRGGRPDVGNDQIRDRARQPALGRDRGHDPRQPLCRSGRGGEGRLRHPQIARIAPSRGQHHLVPVLRAAGIRRDQNRGSA